LVIIEILKLIVVVVATGKEMEVVRSGSVGNVSGISSSGIC
jgi:hypothetical protein